MALSDLFTRLRQAAFGTSAEGGTDAPIKPTKAPKWPLCTSTRLSLGRWCADAGRPTRFKPSSPSPTDAARDGSAKLGHPVQHVTREHGLTPLPR